MKNQVLKLKLSLLAALVFLSSVACSKNWQTLNESGFSVEMPGQITRQEQLVQTPVGPVTAHLFLVDQKTEGYIVGYSEYPPQVFEARDTEAMLDGARDRAIGNVKGKITNERRINLGNATGREITGVAEERNASFTARVYLDKPRIYMLVYTQAGKDNTISEDGKKFLDSFKIAGK